MSCLLGFFIVTQAFNRTATAEELKRKIEPNAINVPDGYEVEAVVANLSVPTTAIFDGKNVLIAESGFQNTAKPRILKITPEGKVEVLLEKGLESPVTGLLMLDKKLYISHKGKISLLQNGKLTDIVTGLPSQGDHQNNKIVRGPDGKIYVGQGTTTNTGVVGEDNYLFGWLDKSPEAHEVPCKDITLTGKNFTTDNPLKKGEKVTTGAYKPLGTSSKPGEIIKGNVKCGGSIIRFNPDGSEIELVAWGLRNPFGLTFDANNTLWSTFHGADVRGSRPVFNDVDYLVEVKQDAWYGWPEYFDSAPVTDERFHEPSKPKPEFLWQKHPELKEPILTFPTHSGTNGIAFSNSDDFGYKGDLFVAEFGTYTVPTAGFNITPNGFRVSKVNMETKEVTSFASNFLPGPSYINQSGGLNRPSDVVFGPDNSLYIVDWGATTIGTDGVKYVPGSGVLWRVSKKGQPDMWKKNTIIISSAALPEEKREPQVRNASELYKYFAPEIIVFSIPIIAIIVVFTWFIAKKLKQRKR